MTNPSEVNNDRRKGVPRRKCDREQPVWKTQETNLFDHEYVDSLTSRICCHILSDSTLPSQKKQVFMSIFLGKLLSGGWFNSEIVEIVESEMRQEQEDAEDLMTILTPRELLFFREICKL
ncbi:MAG: hypothetical protein MI741_15380, partial [Rhodospirillales bacterium]|nr:hypothetical protein [Rhodospirillales bacterium]